MRRVVFFAACALSALLILFNSDAMAAARAGFALWRDNVMPALLPFFVCASLMRHTSFFKGNIGLYAMALVSGAPSGARLIGACYEDDPPGSWSATALAASLNTLSPMYVAGAFATGMLKAPYAALPLIAGQLISAGVCVFLSLRYGAPALQREAAGPNAQPLAKLIVSCISDAALALLSICGTIVFFMVLIRMLEVTRILHLAALPVEAVVSLLGGEPEAAKAVLAGMIEVASGSKAIAELGLPVRVAASAGAFLFSFGGICILFQSLMFMRLDIGKYLVIKLAAGALSGLIVYFLFPLAARGHASVFYQAQSERILSNATGALGIFLVSLVGMSAIMLLSAAVSGMKRYKRR